MKKIGTILKVYILILFALYFTDDDHISTAMSKLDVGNNSKPAEDSHDCAVCLQKCIHPVRLPCSHVFCFLCVKGVAMQSGRCALCRKQITAEFFSNPTVLGVEQSENQGLGQVIPQQPDQYAWFYEGRNGWWQYEERTNQELEESYRKKLRTFELLIAGFVYTIDLDNMLQMRRSDPSRRRRIKRDLVSAPKKGIAGLKITPRVESSGASMSVGANREVLGGECNKSNQATGGGHMTSAPVDDATQTPVDALVQANQDSNRSPNTKQRGTSTDETAYEVLPQPRTSTSVATTRETRRNSDQHSHSDVRGEAAASSGHSKSNRTSSASSHTSQKKAKPRPHARNTAHNHPSSTQARPAAFQNDSYGLVVNHQRAHSSPSRVLGNQTDQTEPQGAVSRRSNRTLSAHDIDGNVEDTPMRSSSRREDEAQTDAQSRRQVRHRRKNLRSSDV